MRRHAGSANVQEWGCKALTNLANGNAESQRKVGEQGGIELVLKAMRGHAGSAKVQVRGCEALTCLACGESSKRKRDWGEFTDRETGRMYFHNFATKVTSWTRQPELTCNAENQGKIGAQGGIELVLEAMRGHAGSAKVQECGCEALTCLACGNDDNHGKIRAQGGIKVITNSMEKHYDDSRVQVEGAALLRVLADVAQQAVASSAASAMSAGAAGKRPRLEAPALSAGAGAAAGSHPSENAETARKVRIICVGAG